MHEMGDPKFPGIPTIAYPNGVGWRLRPSGRERQGIEWKGRGQGGGVPCYIELHCHSCYSFREGASTPQELVSRAAGLGHGALALTDRDGLYGAMEFAKAAEAVGVRPIIGADVTLQSWGGTPHSPRGGHRLVLLAETREGYANLCRLLSYAHLHQGTALSPGPSPNLGGGGRGGGPNLQPSPRGRENLVRPLIPNPQIPLGVLAQHTRGLIALSGDEHGEVASLVAAGRLSRALAAARRYAEWFGPESFFIELQQTLTFGDAQRNHRLVELARQLGLGVVATNDVWYHVQERHRLHDVLVAVHHRTTLDGSHRFRHANSERYLKAAEEMAELFEEWPEALQNSVAIAERCRFDLVQDLGYEFPHAEVPSGETSDTHLARICREALERKYPPPQPSPSPPNPHRNSAQARLEEELALVRKHGLAGFFLAYYDLLQLAGEIAHQLKGRDPSLPPDERPVGRGRGSSVSSIVCYLIGLSHIDPIANELFLGRFLNDELLSVPDIDLDFPRDIRDELLKRIWTRFEEGRAALVCAYSTYHGRSAVRDVGKALGLPALEIDHLAKLVDSWGGTDIAQEMERLPEFRGKLEAPVWRDLVELSQEIMGMPRHVTQHVGGVVLSARPLQELVPLEPTRMEGRVMCQWDKDSVDDARMVKIDFLALGMLSLVDECLDMIEARHGTRPDLGRIPHDDPEVYDRICEGDTIGLFQIESRAQISTLAHTQPRNLDDLAVQVAIVRPGPIVSGAFKPYMEYRRLLREAGVGDQGPGAGEAALTPTLSQRERHEPPIPNPQPPTIKYIHPCLEPVLKDTLGVVLYQEQVVQMAMAIAGYTAGEADLLRRNLNRRRGAELAGEDWPVFLERARARGIPDTAALAAFRTILGFAAYGFPKSHAVAFALLAYESAWLRYRYPAEYYAALFNNQPMGFYTTEVIAGDARRHGIEIARPDVNLSRVGCWPEAEEGLGVGDWGLERWGPHPSPLPQPGRGRGRRRPTPNPQPPTSIRLGLAEVRGIGRDRLGRSPVAEAIVAEREANGPFRSVVDFADRTGLRPEIVENLIVAGAWNSPRRELLWESGLLRERRASYGRGRAIGGAGAGSRARQQALPLPIDQDLVALPPMSAWEEVAGEYEVLGLAPRGHAMELLRPALGVSGSKFNVSGEPETRNPKPETLATSAQVRDLPDGAEVLVVGLVVCRQRPSTARGVVFLSLEDEYGLTNVVVYPSLFDRQRVLILTEPFLMVYGRVQRQGTVVHVVAHRFERPDVSTDRLIRVSHDFR